MLARNVSAQIKIAAQDVTRDVENLIIGVEYEDASSGETDTCAIELMDISRKFLGEWMPTRGDTLEITLNKKQWGDGEASQLDLGIFEIDEICNEFAPSICKIKGNSISQLSALRQTDKSRSWENVKLSEIASQIAAEAGLELFYDTPEDPEISRAEQDQISDLAFLQKLCSDNYLCLKVSDNKLIIFDESKREQAEPVMTIERDVSQILRFSAKASIQEIYRKAEVSYKHGQQDNLYIGGFEVPGRESGKTLKINSKVNSQAEAERLAKNKLRSKNREEIKVQITCVGDFRLLAGNVVTLKNFGFYDGRYLLQKTRHSIGNSGYVTEIEAYRCLGY